VGDPFTPNSAFRLPLATIGRRARCLAVARMDNPFEMLLAGSSSRHLLKPGDNIKVGAPDADLTFQKQ
jgi:hypothetical protein